MCGYNATRRTSFRSWFLVCHRVLHPVLILQHQWHLKDRRGIVLHLLQARLLHQLQQHQVTVRLKKGRIKVKLIPIQCLCQVQMLMIERGNPCDSEIPEWLQEFREILVDDEIPLQGGSHASSSHEVSLEPTSKRREDLSKHSVQTHFPKDRNCEICQRNKITRAPLRRHNGGAVPRAEIFGDLITADHKVLNDNCESRNSHRYEVVVQDLATQCIQSYPCKTETYRKHREACKSSWSPIGSLKSFTLTIPWNLAKPVKIFPGIIARLHHTDRRQNGIAGRAVRRVKEGTSAVLLQSGLNESWWADSMDCYTNLRNVTDLLSDGKTPCGRCFWQPFKGPIIPFGSLVEYHPITAKGQSRIHQFGKNVLPGLLLGYAVYAGRIWKGDVLVAGLEELETMDASKIFSKKDSMRKRWYFPKKRTI